YWFETLGNVPLELEIGGEPRVERRLAVVSGPSNTVLLGQQEEALVALQEAEAVAHLVPGVVPAPDWSRRVLDAHQEGFALVGGAIDPGRNRALAPWASGAGRIPAFGHPLLCPSVVKDVEPAWAEPVEGLPAAYAPEDEPSVFDGRIVLRLASRRRTEAV